MNGAGPGAGVPRLLRVGGVYPGWIMVLALGITETVSYGVLSYAFPVFLAPMEGELGWSRTQLTGAFSLAALIAGVAALPLGRWIDRHGARGVMTAGSVLAAALLVGWSRTETLAGYYLVWAGLGLASAAVLYEPAFAVVASWFVRKRGRALTVLTFMGGFASVIFVPLATALVAARGWREALVWLAVILAASTIAPHALLLRRRPEDHGLAADGATVRSPDLATGVATTTGGRGATIGEALASPGFRWLALAFACSAMANTALMVHLIPLLLEAGHGAAPAAAAVGLIGLMALPGRLIFTPLGDRLPRSAVTASIFLLQAIAIGILMVGSDSIALWAFVLFFGAGFGAITPARAALVADLFGTRSFAGISGAMTLLLAFARAVGPVAASVLHAAGGYGPMLGAALVVTLAAGGAVLLTGRTAAGPGALPALS
jgi:MFS family permease